MNLNCIIFIILSIMIITILDSLLKRYNPYVEENEILSKTLSIVDIICRLLLIFILPFFSMFLHSENAFISLGVILYFIIYGIFVVSSIKIIKEDFNIIKNQTPRWKF